jgi:hypothetical protein
MNDITISGSDIVNFQSNTAGEAWIYAIGRNGNNSILGNVIVFVRPNGKITIS